MPGSYQENPSVRFGGATARSPDDWATRFGPYSRERVSVDGASVSTRPRKGKDHNWLRRTALKVALLTSLTGPWMLNKLQCQSAPC